MSEPMSAQEAAARRTALMEEKMALDEQIAALRDRVTDAKRNAKLRQVYIDSSLFRSLEKELAAKGRESQRLQFAIAQVRRERAAACAAKPSRKKRLVHALTEYIAHLRLNEPDCDDIADELEAILLASKSDGEP